MNNIYFGVISISMVGLFGISFVYWKIFGNRRYKILKDYMYKDYRIQLIKNPQNNVCGVCYEILEEHEEIGRFPKCDHHYCEKCIRKLIDDSHSNIKKRACAMCMEEVV